jgi:energy-coupling factor transport system permease protein
VLESALDRSLQLASSMDARGYGRRALVTKRTRRLAAGSTSIGMLLVIAGVYGVLDVGSLPAGGIPFVAVGAALVGVGMAVGGRRTERTRYRPDLWGRPEWVVAGSGAAVLASFIVASVLGVSGMQLQVYPLRVPLLPLLPLAGVLAGLVPAAAAPVVRPRSVARPVGPRAGSEQPVVEPEGILR